MRIEKPGYETVTKKIKPEDSGALREVVLEVETQPRGIVYVDAAGPEAVWIDGQYSGFMTPTPGVIVTAGDHTVQLRDASGAVLDQQRVHVEKGGTARVVLQLRARKRAAR